MLTKNYHGIHRDNDDDDTGVKLKYIQILIKQLNMKSVIVKGEEEKVGLKNFFHL